MRSLIALTAAVLAACSAPQSKEAPTMAQGSDAAMDAGKAEVARRFPDFSPARKTPVVADHGETWEFTYELPADMLGGAPVVVLNKADLSVKDSYRTQ